MKGQWMRVAAAGVCLLMAGCQTSGAASSGNSSQGDSSQSDSGNSSQGDSSQSDSGNSSQGDSSQSESSRPMGESSRGSAQWSSDTAKASEATTNNSADATVARSENSSQSRSSQASSGPVLSATTVGVTVGALGLVIWRALLSAPAAPEPAEVARAAEVYLRARTHQLREDLALGAGPTIEDLAAMARIRRENLGAFGRLLRAHRGELLALADSSALTPARALRWLERVGQLARAEPRLEEDRRAFLAAHGVME